MGTGCGIGKQQLHVFGAHVFAVDAVGGARFPLNTAADLQLGKIIELGRCRALVIINEQGDVGQIACRAVSRARKNHIIHPRAAQAFGAVFTHYPAQGLQKVRLATAIGTHNTGHAGLNLELGRIDEGFKSRKS